MTEQELCELRKICIHLGEIVQKYGEKYYTIQIKALFDIINCIDSDMNENEKSEYILNRYNVLYPSHGGLNEFYIHNDDFQTRLELNEPLDKLKERFWEIIKQYI